MTLKTGRKRSRLRNLALPMAMAAILLGTPAVGWAQATNTVTVTGTGNAAVDKEYLNLTTAITTVEGTTVGNYDPSFNITADQTITSGLKLGEGSGGNGGWNNVTLEGAKSGSAGAAVTLTHNGSAMTGAMLSILNTTTNIALNNLTFTGGHNTSPYDSTSVYNTRSGGGLFIGRSSSMAGLNSFRGELTMGNVNFTNNKVDLSASGGAAMGGGLSVVNIDDPGGTAASLGTANWTNVNFTNNQAINNANAPGGGNAIGGAARVLGVETLTYSNSMVSGNKATVQNQDHAHGGGLALEGNDFEATLTSITFSGNEASANGNGSGAAAWARGGALYGASETGTTGSYLDLYNSSFSNNKATATGTDVHAEGGAVTVLGNVAASFISTTFTGNQATSELSTAKGGAVASNAYADGAPVPAEEMAFSNVTFTSNTAQGATQAQGGAVYASAGAMIDSNSQVTGNQAVATGAGALAQGGAVFSETFLTTYGSTFSSNEAKAENGGTARGGAIYAAGSVVAESAAFTGNKALGDAGYGGAVYLNGGLTHSLANTSLTGNTASTQGGAVFLDTEAAAPSNLRLGAIAGSDVVISGNKNGIGESDGIYIGRATGGNSGNAATVDILTDTGGTFSMLDTMTVDMNSNMGFTMNKTGDGTFVWDNAHNITMDGAAAAINLKEGTTSFGRDFTLKAETANTTVNVDIAGNVDPTQASTVLFDSNRKTDLALFDFTDGNSGANSVTVTGGGQANIGLSDVKRRLMDFSETYVFVDGQGNATGGTTAADLNTNFAFNDNLQSSIFTDDGSQILLTINYQSQHGAALMAAGSNTWNARYGLDALLNLEDANGDLYISDAEVDAIYANLGAVTAEYGMASGREAVNTTMNFHSIAVLNGLKKEHTPNLWMAPPAGGGGETGSHVWAAYVGNFRTVDDNGGYYGYDQDTNGGMIGLSYEMSPAATIGIYGGATKGELEYDRINSKVDSDGIHVGAALRFSPAQYTDPGLSVYANIGYSHYENDGSRTLAPYVASSTYDQKVLTVAAGVEYQVSLNNDVRFTPELELRYTKLDQDDINEVGLTASTVYGYKADSLVSNLGVTLSKDVAVQGGFATPSLRLGWRHEFGDRDYNTFGVYRNPGNPIAGVGSPYLLSTVPVDRDTLDVGVAVKAMYDTAPGQQMGLNLSYDFSTSKNTDSHSVYGGLEFKF